MKALGTMLSLCLVACSTPGPAQKPAGAPAVPAASAPFAGHWESCEGAPSQEECARYILGQRGRRICGTWSYVASGQVYQGRVIARAVSATRARQTHVCGRPGSETGTECEDGWESIDQPLVLCGGRLADRAGADGTCAADYQPVPAPESNGVGVPAEAWVQACLSTDP